MKKENKTKKGHIVNGSIKEVQFYEERAFQPKPNKERPKPAPPKE